MENELFFCCHVFLVVGFLLFALRWGKGALQILIALQAVLANLFVIKQISFFGFSVTCSDVYSIGAILGLNLLQEYWGGDEARKAVKYSLMSLVFFTLMSQMHLWYFPIAEDRTQEAFSILFSQTPRIALASIAVYYLVQRLDVRFFEWLKKTFATKYLPLRIGISLILAQFVDTLLFSFLGLYGLVTSLFDIVVISFLIKCLIIGLSSPMTTFSKRFVKDASLQV